MQMERIEILGLCVVLSFLAKAAAITCYNCSSLADGEENCGPLFESYGLYKQKCDDDTAVCILQRQRAIPEIRQMGAVARGCYNNPLPWINMTLGCRHWTNPDDPTYTALYCFCDTNLCNGTSPPAALLSGSLWALLIWICSVWILNVA